MSGRPPIPDEGLAEVLGSWSGRGYLWDALAAPAGAKEERQWSARDLRCRAHRVLLERLTPALARWPTRLAEWIDLLPATKIHARAVRGVPFAGVSWPATRVRYGWPPAQFIGRESERRADMLVVTTLRWTAELLVSVRADALRAFPDVDASVRAQLDAAAQLLETEPVGSASPLRPARPEIMALRSEGSPWGAVAEVADELRSVGASINELSWRLLLPDDEIRWRLFHLGVLGTLLRSLRGLGCAVASLRPFGALGQGPAYRITDSKGRCWDLWFEAGGFWAYEGIPSPYIEATGSLSGSGRPIGADLLLVRRGAGALIFECKYSANPETVARDGYYQATTYAAEIRSRFSGSVMAAVVGPELVVPGASFTGTVVGEIGTISPSHISATVIRFFKGIELAAPPSASLAFT